MHAEAFFDLVLGGDGYRCCFSIKPDDTGRKQDFVKSNAELASVVANRDSAGRQTYFWLATSSNKSRLAQDAEVFKALFLDLDCGPSKEFPDQPTALKQLKKFIRAASLPKPMIVDSGRGIHVYWPLTDAVRKDIWLPTARALKTACVAHEFPADPTVTVDAARVLRPPHTHNYKDDPAPEVQVIKVGKPHPIEVFRAKLKDYKSDKPGDFFANKPDYVRDMPAAHKKLLENKETSFRNILQLTAEGKGCAQLQYCVENAADLSEPMWRAALSVAKFCTEGEKAGHKISKAHPEYSKWATNKKMRSIKGPYTCGKFDEGNPGVCQECPHFGKIKSPISIGSTVKDLTDEERVIEDVTETGEEVTYEIPQFPPGYKPGKNGGVYKEDFDDDGNPSWKLITSGTLYYYSRIHDPHFDGEIFFGRLHLPNDPVREFQITNVQGSSRDDLRRVLAKAGVVSLPSGWSDILTYSTQWMDYLQKDTNAPVAHLQFGWTNDNFDAFLLGTRLIKADSVEFSPPSQSIAMYAAYMNTKGSLENWVKKGEFFNHKGLEPWQWMALFGVGAPLMGLLKQRAGIFNMFSEKSGLGKSSAQLFSLAAYGHPLRLKIGSDDTVASVWNRAEKYKNLPLQWDELTNIDAKAASDLIYAPYDGLQRNRMDGSTNSERYRGEPWATTFGITNNESLMGKVRAIKGSSDGNAKRIVEWDLEKYTFHPKEEGDAFWKSLDDDYGHAGEVFVQYIIRNLDEVRALIDTVQKELDVTAGLKGPDRFYSAIGTVVIVANVICRECGLLQYDTQGIKDFTLALIQGNRAVADDNIKTASDHVGEYIADNYGNILRVDGKPASDSVRPDWDPRQSIMGRYEPDTENFYWPCASMRAYCHANHVEYSALGRRMKTELGAERVKKRITAGLNLHAFSVWCYEIPCGELDIKVEDPGAGEADGSD